MGFPPLLGAARPNSDAPPVRRFPCSVYCLLKGLYRWLKVNRVVYFPQTILRVCLDGWISFGSGGKGVTAWHISRSWWDTDWHRTSQEMSCQDLNPEWKGTSKTSRGISSNIFFLLQRLMSWPLTNVQDYMKTGHTPVLLTVKFHKNLDHTDLCLFILQFFQNLNAWSYQPDYKVYLESEGGKLSLSSSLSSSVFPSS